MKWEEEFKAKERMMRSMSEFPEFYDVKNNEIKLLLTDIRMPGGDGISLIKNLQENSLKKFPVIVMTGFSDMSPDEIVALGANQVLLKPFRFKEFVDLLKLHLS